MTRPSTSAWSSRRGSLPEHEIRIGTAPGGETVDEAIEQLQRPFLLLVENEESDRSFIEAVATPQYRGRLARMFRRGWLVFRSRGGISGIKPMIAQTLKDFPGDGRRMFAVFDSDAPAPGKPHAQARKVVEACRQNGIVFRMLARRAIENYLTRGALTAWANTQSAGVAELQSKIEALYGDWFGERPERRHHFEMKKGFDGMVPRDPIYEGLPAAVEKDLSKGLGSDVAKAFGTGELREVDLRDEGAWDELSEMIESLVRRMR